MTSHSSVEIIYFLKNLFLCEKKSNIAKTEGFIYTRRALAIQNIVFHILKISIKISIYEK
jgi:hypothetical protein